MSADCRRHQWTPPAGAVHPFIPLGGSWRWALGLARSSSPSTGLPRCFCLWHHWVHSLGRGSFLHKCVQTRSTFQARGKKQEVKGGRPNAAPHLSNQRSHLCACPHPSAVALCLGRLPGSGSHSICSQLKVICARHFQGHHTPRAPTLCPPLT